MSFENADGSERLPAPATASMKCVVAWKAVWAAACASGIGAGGVGV
jgi:hypothetical protein